MSSPKRILLLDTGNEWGGGTNSMFELLKRLDRQRFAVTCCFYKDYRKGKAGRLLSEELADIGIPLILLPIRPQPLWAKLAKELVRGLFSWSARLRKSAPCWPSKCAGESSRASSPCTNCWKRVAST